MASGWDGRKTRATAGSKRSSTPVPKERRGDKRPRDPRVEGRVSLKAERIRLPDGLSDPLGMGAGQADKAREAPPSKAPDLNTLPPIEQRRTIPFIRAADGSDDALTPQPSLDDEVLLPAGDWSGDRGASAAPLGRRHSATPEDGTWLPEDRAKTDPAPALDERAARARLRQSSAPSVQPPTSSPASDSEAPTSLVRALAEEGPEGADQGIANVLSLGPGGLDAITRLFPGKLWFDPAVTRGRPPAAEQVSALASALVRAGPPAVPHLVHLLGASDRTVRFCAALVARELNDESVVQPLFRMLVDADPDNVDVAMLAIRSLNPQWVTPRLDQLRQSLEQSGAAPGQHLMAARTLGALRDVASVGPLIERIGARHQDVASAVRAALEMLTLQNHKTSRSRWRRWLKRHGNEPRVSWLLEGLVRSEPEARVRAFRELVLLTGRDLSVHRTANKTDAQALRGEYHAIAIHQGLLKL